MPKQIPCLWFDGQAEEAAQHYTSIFPNSSIGDITGAGPSVIKGGITLQGVVNLLAATGLKVDGVAYTAQQAAEPGRTVVMRRCRPARSSAGRARPWHRPTAGGHCGAIHR